MLALRPRMPRHLDAEQLRYANDLGFDTWEDEQQKFDIRAAAWESIAAEPSPA